MRKALIWQLYDHNIIIDCAHLLAKTFVIYTPRIKKKDKTIDGKLMYIPNDDKQNNSFVD